MCIRAEEAYLTSGKCSVLENSESGSSFRIKMSNVTVSFVDKLFCISFFQWNILRFLWNEKLTPVLDLEIFVFTK